MADRRNVTFRRRSRSSSAWRIAQFPPDPDQVSVLQHRQSGEVGVSPELSRAHEGGDKTFLTGFLPRIVGVHQLQEGSPDIRVFP